MVLESTKRCFDIGAISVSGAIAFMYSVCVEHSCFSLTIFLKITNMAKVVIYRGDSDLSLKTDDQATYCYQIGVGRLLGDRLININDSETLDEITLSIRDDYVDWIYSLNSLFIKDGLIKDGVSLFFYSDMSNKRSELFDTYESLANILLLKRQLRGIDIDVFELIGLDRAFTGAIKSLYPKAIIKYSRVRPLRIRLGRRLMADAKYFIEAMLVVVINWCMPNKDVKSTSESQKYYFSYYPHTFNSNLTDIRYGEHVGEKDNYLVTIIADGMHQQVSPIAYFKYVRRLPNRTFLLVDRYLRFMDVFVGFVWLCRCYKFLYSQRDKTYQFLHIDISGFIKQELIQSISRIARLVLISGAFKKAIKASNMRELVYINFESSFGRMISAVVANLDQNIYRTGFNHGDYSWRFINYFLAAGEARVRPPYIKHCPIPDRVLAEDELCADIYKHNGYQNVEVLEKVYRLSYLDGIEPTRQEEYALIATGLHDGDLLVKTLLPLVKEQKAITFYLKPHPRSDKRYLDAIPAISNLFIVEKPIEELLTIVGRIYVTYSSVGVEGRRLGIPISLVKIPGKICWSKLLDYPEFRGQSG